MQLHTPQSLDRVHGLGAVGRGRSLTAVAISALGALWAQINGAVSLWRAAWKAEQDYKVLLAMPDYRLRDIGLSRQDIRDAVAGKRQVRSNGS
jgi:uncharacterized protein YjiS (DUF1127 family)